MRPIYVGEGLDPPAQTAPPHSLKPHVETQNVPFLVILSERSESKDPGSIDGAKILRLPLVAQDDRFGRSFHFAENIEKRKILLPGGSRPSPTASNAVRPIL